MCICVRDLYAQSCSKAACKGISIRFCEEHYEEFRRAMKGSFGDDNDAGDSVQCTLQQQVALLKKQLQDSGQVPVEFVELSVARERMQAAVQRLMGGDESAEKDIERWDKAIRMNPEYQVGTLMSADIYKVCCLRRRVSRKNWRTRRSSGRKTRGRRTWSASAALERSFPLMCVKRASIR